MSPLGNTGGCRVRSSGTTGPDAASSSSGMLIEIVGLTSRPAGKLSPGGGGRDSDCAISSRGSVGIAFAGSGSRGAPGIGAKGGLQPGCRPAARHTITALCVVSTSLCSRSLAISLEVAVSYQQRQRRCEMTMFLLLYRRPSAAFRWTRRGQLSHRVGHTKATYAP